MDCHNTMGCTFAFETKAEDDTVAVFSGIASTADIDSQHDVIETGAFDPIARKDTGEPDVLMLRDHDRSKVIGGWTDFTQHGHQLLVEGELCLAVEAARETYALMKRRFLSGISVGFQLPEDGFKIDYKNRRRHIQKAILRECSIVAFPANAGARIISVKQDNDFWEWLSSRGFKDEDIYLLEREGLDALIKQRRHPTKITNVTKREPLILGIEDVTDQLNEADVAVEARELLVKMKGFYHGCR